MRQTCDRYSLSQSNLACDCSKINTWLPPVFRKSKSRDWPREKAHALPRMTEKRVKSFWIENPINPEFFSNQDYVKQTGKKITTALSKVPLDGKLPLDYQIALTELLYLYQGSKVEESFEKWGDFRNLYCSIVWKDLNRTDGEDEETVTAADGHDNSTKKNEPSDPTTKKASSPSPPTDVIHYPRSFSTKHRIVPRISQLLRGKVYWDSMKLACDICAFSPFQLFNVTITETSKKDPLKQVDADWQELFPEQAKKEPFPEQKYFTYEISKKEDDSKGLLQRLTNFKYFGGSESRFTDALALFKNLLHHFYLSRSNLIDFLLFDEKSILFDFLTNPPSNSNLVEGFVTFLMSCLRRCGITDISQTKFQSFLEKVCTVLPVDRKSKLHQLIIPKLNSLYPKEMNQTLKSSAISDSTIEALQKVGIIQDQSVDARCLVKYILVPVVLFLSLIITWFFSLLFNSSSKYKSSVSKESSTPKFDSIYDNDSHLLY